MMEIKPTIEHLKKQIEFYEKEYERVAEQLRGITSRLNSDRYAVKTLETQVKIDEDTYKALSKGSIPPTTLSYTGTQDGIIDVRDEYIVNKPQKTGTL